MTLSRRLRRIALRFNWVVAASIPLCLPMGYSAALALEEATSRGEVLAEHGDAFVRIEVVLSAKMTMGGQGQEQESRMDVIGAVVDPGGLVMLWNSNISSARLNEMIADMGSGSDFKMEVAPTAFKVTIDEVEYEAFLAATDSALDLAFIQLEAIPDVALAFVDYSQLGSPAVGDPVLQVQRLGPSFDDAPFVTGATIAGTLRKPRPALILDGQLTGFGLPVFDLEDRPVGALTTIYSRAGEDAGGMMGMGPMSGMFGQGSPFEALQSFVLPGPRVASLVRLARERAKELASERAEMKSEEGEGGP